MKKALSIILVFSLLISISACSQKTTEVNDITAANTAAADSATQKNDSVSEDPSDIKETEAPLVEPAEPIKEWDGTFKSLQLLNQRNYQYYWGKSERSIIDVHYPDITLDEVGKTHFPELEKSLEKMDDDIENSVLGTLDELKSGAEKEYNEAASEFGDAVLENFSVFANKYDAYVTRADSNAVSILMKHESYAGEPDVSIDFNAYNFDTQSGKELKLKDVVSDTAAFAKLVKEFIQTYYPDKSLFEKTNMDDLLGYKYSWVMTNEGVTMYYRPGDIDSYQDGYITATVTYKGHEDLFNKKYTQCVENYFQELVENAPNYFDVDGDGRYERILSYQMIDDSTRIATTMITVDDATEQNETESHSLRTFIVKNDGKVYAHQFMTLNTNYPYTRIYELTSGKPVSHSEGYYWLANKFDEARKAMEMIPSDAANIKLAMKMWLLGTYQAIKNYHIDDKGILTSEEPWYEIAGAPPITFIRGMEFDVVNEKGEVIGKRKAHVADKLNLYRTDYDNFIDGKFDDGTIIRMNVELGDSQFYVNGVSEKELFDGIVYTD